MLACSVAATRDLRGAPAQAARGGGPARRPRGGHQLARTPPGAIGGLSLADVEGPGAGVVRPCLEGEPARTDLGTLRARHEVFQPTAEQGRASRRCQCGTGGVHVDDPAESVDDEDGVGHALDDGAARERGQVHEPLAEQAPHQHAAGDGERERCQVDAGEPADLEVVEEVRRPRQQCGGEQQQGHAEVDAPQPDHARHEERGGPDEQQVVVAEDRPERRARLDDRQVLRRGCGRVGPDKVVGGRHRQHRHRRDDRDRQEQQQPPRHEVSTAGVLEHEDQPRRRESHHADVLEVTPPALRCDVIDRQLDGVRQPPPRDGHQEHREAPPHAVLAAPRDVRRQRRQDQAGDGHEDGEQRQHPRPPSRTSHVFHAPWRGTVRVPVRGPESTLSAGAQQVPLFHRGRRGRLGG